MLKRLMPDPLLVLIIGTVLLASFLPPTGRAVGAVSTISAVAIFALFFFHGAKIAPAALGAAFVYWRLHGLIFGFTFLMFPLLGLGLIRLPGGWLPAEIVVGLFFLCALPSTVQSSIAFTSIAGGNVPAAITAASVSQLLGVALTPLLLGIVIGTATGKFDLAGLEGVALQILLPFALGQLARPLIGGWVQRRKTLIGRLDRTTILFAIYNAFSRAVNDGIWTMVTPGQLALLGGICLVMLVLFLALTHWTGRLTGLAREDRIVLQFCGTKKSLVQAIPMASVLFAGPTVGLVLLPIMIFHQVQLMACSWLANRYAREAENVRN